MKKNYNDDIYIMYEEECKSNIKLNNEIKNLKLEISNLKYELKYKSDSFDIKLNSEIEKATKPLIEETNNISNKLDDAYKEIDRLKNELNNKNYTIDKLECSIKKDSSNSGIPTSKEITKEKKNVESKTNTYNHRQKSCLKTGAQLGHKGTTLTTEDLLTKVEKNNVKIKEIIHYIKGKNNKKDTIKYKIGMNVELYVEKHIFKYDKNAKNLLPKDFYSNVSYTNDLKSLVVTLGNYYSLGYSKVKEIIYDFSNGIINISEGTIDNIYEEFSNNSDETISNITNNLLNGKYQHTDETTTKENGKDSYYRGYSNNTNILYKYHHHKGDAPIEDDNILTRFYGTIISDHEVGIFKYGTNNQDCVIHTGRYCIEANQNINETCWQIELYRFLLKIERQRKILTKFGKNNFTTDEIKSIEKEYDKILINAEEQNKFILSTYWKEKQETFLRRLRKYKNTTLFFVHDFSIPYDNNAMERLLRMIKGKTKVSGGFRSFKGGERFGKIMSIIKTAKLRNLNQLKCIEEIYQGKSLFA